MAVSDSDDLKKGRGGRDEEMEEEDHHHQQHHRPRIRKISLVDEEGWACIDG